MNDSEDKKSSRQYLMGCVIPLAVVVALLFGLAIFLSRGKPVKPSAPPAFIANAAEKVNEQRKKLTDRVKEFFLKRKDKKDKEDEEVGVKSKDKEVLLPVKSSKSEAKPGFKLPKKSISFDTGKGDYDIDQTIKALFSIEAALAEAENFEDLTAFILQKDSDQVAPDVLKLKYDFFNLYKNLLSIEDEYNELTSIYNVTTGTLLDLLATGGYVKFNLDFNRAKHMWKRRMQETKLKREIRKRLELSRQELLEFFFQYLKVSSKYYREWNELCALRDRAYLAVYEGDWNEAVKCAAGAVKKSPSEKEAHILMAMGLLERGGEGEVSQARMLIDDYLKKNQGQEAPGYLLRGVANLKDGKYDQAVLDFDQAATYYPKQQEALLDRLNLYKKRSFLNKSREGRMIQNIYRSFMTGSGYFSPDFQKARIYVSRNQPDKAKKKIFDHFFRRRRQGQWDQVLTDFLYCNKLIESDIYEISDGDKINLEIAPAFFTNSVIVTVNNNSNKNIHNLTVLLCVRFTDMFKKDYISFPVGETVALLKAGESVTVGRQYISGITREKLGMVKKFKDIIEYAAVLISDETILWVESAQVEEIRERQKDKKSQVVDSIVRIMKDSLSKVKEKDWKKISSDTAHKVVSLIFETISEKDKPLNKDDKKKLIEKNERLLKELMKMTADQVKQKVLRDEKDPEKRREIQKIIDKTMDNIAKEKSKLFKK